MKLISVLSSHGVRGSIWCGHIKQIYIRHKLTDSSEHSFTMKEFSAYRQVSACNALIFSPDRKWCILFGGFYSREIKGCVCVKVQTVCQLNMEEQRKILCVGLVCLDIINVVDKYPEEDTDSRLVHSML